MLALAAPFFAYSLSVALPSVSRSSAITHACVEARQSHPESALTTGLSAELDSLWVDCSRAGWDGYEAKAVSPDAFRAAKRFVASLPLGIPQPEIAADPDGCVTFEWRRSARQTLLVSVRPGYALDYAALIGTAKTHGTEPFFDEFPEPLTSIIQRILSA